VSIYVHDLLPWNFFQEMSHFENLNCEVENGITDSFDTCIQMCDERENLSQLVTWLKECRELTDGITNFSLNQANEFGNDFLAPAYNRREKTYHLNFKNTAGEKICKARKYS
jgi:hypothetical protein